VCTLTWRPEPDGYQVFFNRDERRGRKPGLPPAARVEGGTRFVAPLDGDHGGTWIAASEHGVTLCVLNGPPALPGDPRLATTSRGTLPIALIGARDAARSAERLQGLDLRALPPFVLVALDPSGGGMQARWSGRSLAIELGPPSRQPLVSSSFGGDEVRLERLAVFREKLRDSDPSDATGFHLAYHASHEPAPGPASPCMHRPEAGTVSFSWVRVDRRAVRFWYVGHPPCEGPPLEPVCLARSGSTGAF
jgi:hypothetical protein